MVQLEQRQVFFVLMGIFVMASGILILGYVMGLRTSALAPMNAKAVSEGGVARGFAKLPEPDAKKVELTFHERVMSPTAALEPLPQAPTPAEMQRRGKLAKAVVAKAMQEAEAADQSQARQAKKQTHEQAKVKAKAKAKAKATAKATARAKANRSAQRAQGRRMANAILAKAELKKRVELERAVVKARKEAALVKERLAKSHKTARTPPHPAVAVERQVDEVTADALSILKKLRAGGDQHAPSAPSTRSPGAASPSADRRYTVQVGAFKERSDALSLLDKLRAADHNPFLVASNVRARGRWYRVRVGRFASKDKAMQYQRRLEVSEGLKGTFVARR